MDQDDLDALLHTTHNTLVADVAARVSGGAPAQVAPAGKRAKPRRGKASRPSTSLWRKRTVLAMAASWLLVVTVISLMLVTFPPHLDRAHEPGGITRTGPPGTVSHGSPPSPTSSGPPRNVYEETPGSPYEHVVLLAFQPGTDLLTSPASEKLARIAWTAAIDDSEFTVYPSVYDISTQIGEGRVQKVVGLLSILGVDSSRISVETNYIYPGTGSLPVPRDHVVLVVSLG